MSDTPKLWTAPSGTVYELIPSARSNGCEGCALSNGLSADCMPSPCDDTSILKVASAKNKDLMDAARYRKLRDSGKFVPGMGNAGWALACGVTGKVGGAARKALDDAVDAMGGGNV